jgi:hypothetical protein
VGAKEIAFSLLTKTRPPRRQTIADRVRDTARIATRTPKTTVAVAAGAAIAGFAAWRWRRGLAGAVGKGIEEIGDAIEEVGDAIEDAGEAMQGKED